jgi:hypothetical protein
MSVISIRERLLGLGAAARLFPPMRAGKSVSPITLWRWSRNGARRRDGRVVRLETLRVGARTVTSVEAIERFVGALNADVDTSMPQATAQSDVERELDALRL